MPSPYSSCVDMTNFDSVMYREFIALGKTYQQSMCYQMFLQYLVIQNCNCSSPFLPQLSKYTRMCSVEAYDCSFRPSRFLNDQTRALLNAWCPLECVRVSYDFVTYSDVFPSQQHASVLRSNSFIAGRFEEDGITPPSENQAVR